VIRKRPTARAPRRDSVIANMRIRATTVRVIGEAGEQLGIMELREALQKSQEVDKDLVMITEKAQPPVVKIIDIAKFKYQQQQRDSENRKKAKAQDTKEVRFKPFMGENDFETRLRQVERFLKGGDKVRLSLEFRGRAITKKEFGFEMFARIIAATNEFATIEIEPKLMGKKLMAQLMPAKKTGQSVSKNTVEAPSQDAETAK
jgi:translation initiation factor IF-3